MRKILIMILLIILLVSCNNEMTNECYDNQIEENNECVFIIHEVSYEETNGDVIEVIEVRHGETVAMPEPPVKQGYFFSGWYYEYDYETLFDSSKPIDKDIKLYARWEFDSYTYFDNYLSELGFIGTALISVKGEVILHKGYGISNNFNSSDKENGPGTIYQIGSTTKQFTAVSIMILLEQGKLTLDDTLDMYIEDYPNGDSITIHNLLVQDSGIPEYAHIRWDDDNYKFIYNSPEDLIKLFKYEPLLHEPGERFSYSNSNYLLLGYIIEMVSELTYEDFLDQYIFSPIGMSNSGIYNLESSFFHAQGYSKRYNQLTPYEARHPSLAYAAGAIESTTTDLYKWHQALCQYKLITEESTKKLYEMYVENDDPRFEGYGDGYGYGWFVFDTESVVVEHGGGINAFRSGFYRDLENDITIITLSNTNEYLHIEIREEVISKLNELLIEPLIEDKNYYPLYFYGFEGHDRSVIYLSDVMINFVPNMSNLNGDLYIYISGGISIIPFDSSFIGIEFALIDSNGELKYKKEIDIDDLGGYSNSFNDIQLIFEDIPMLEYELLIMPINATSM